MLLLFGKTRYGTLVRAIVGIAILAFGVADHARIGTAIGVLLIAWSAFSMVSTRRARAADGGR